MQKGTFVAWSSLLSCNPLWVKVAQLCLTPCDPMGSTVHGILQARILEWVAFPFSRGSSHPGIELGSPSLQEDSLPAELTRKPLCFSRHHEIFSKSIILFYVITSKVWTFFFIYRFVEIWNCQALLFFIFFCSSFPFITLFSLLLRPSSIHSSFLPLFLLLFFLPSFFPGMLVGIYLYIIIVLFELRRMKFDLNVHSWVHFHFCTESVDVEISELGVFPEILSDFIKLNKINLVCNSSAFSLQSYHKYQIFFFISYYIVPVIIHAL